MNVSSELNATNTNQEDKQTPTNKLGFGDNKVAAPKSMGEMIELLAKIMASTINNNVDPESARMALNAATRIIEAQQADTRMKALAIATDRSINRATGWALVDPEPPRVEVVNQNAELEKA